MAYKNIYGFRLLLIASYWAVKRESCKSIRPCCCLLGLAC